MGGTCQGQRTKGKGQHPKKTKPITEKGKGQRKVKPKTRKGQGQRAKVKKGKVKTREGKKEKISSVAPRTDAPAGKSSSDVDILPFLFRSIFTAVRH